MKQHETITTQTATSHIQDPYLTKFDVAMLVRKNVRTVDLWMKKGFLPYLKIGKGPRATILFRRADIEAHLASRFGVGIQN